MNCFTIGHSNHPIENFIDLLRSNEIDSVVDVRSTPYSKYARDYNQEVFETSLTKNNIEYLFKGNELGARFTDPLLKDNDGKIDFEKVGSSAFFTEAIDRLIEVFHNHKTAIMCSEKYPVDCHRFSLLSRALVNKNINVMHILADNQVVENIDLEKDIMNEHKSQLSFFDLNKNEEDLLSEAYKDINKKIAYSG